uniref:Uncharacterized protein n=1 Tax=Theileria annulata TaxID=5874 RepID=A0A3B0N9R7_THEAN
MNDLYFIVTGTYLTDSNKCSEISNFLLQLLSKDYNEISSTFDKLLNDDETLRNSLHSFVLKSAPIALNNINYTNNSLHHVVNLSKIAFDIKSSNLLSYKSTELEESLTRIVEELTEINSEYPDYKYLNSLLNFLNNFELNDTNLSFLLSINKVLNSTDSIQSELATFISNKVRNLLVSVELELFTSFSNDFDENTKIIELIKKIGLSSVHEISVGFLKNRFDYLNNCFNSCVLKSNINIQRNVFGDIDVNLSTFVNRVFQEFFDTIMKINSQDKLDSDLNLSQLDEELINLSKLLSPLGLSFHHITNFTLTNIINI